MSFIKKLLAIPVLLLIYLGTFLATSAGHLINWLLSMIVVFTGICTIWAWIIGDKMAPIFLGIFCLFSILMGMIQLLAEKGLRLAAKLSDLIRTNT